MSSYMQRFEQVLFSPAYADPRAGWRSIANESSAIDFFLFEASPASFRLAGGWAGAGPYQPTPPHPSRTLPTITPRASNIQLLPEPALAVHLPRARRS